MVQAPSLNHCVLWCEPRHALPQLVPRLLLAGGLPVPPARLSCFVQRPKEASAAKA